MKRRNFLKGLACLPFGFIAIKEVKKNESKQKKIAVTNKITGDGGYLVSREINKQLIMREFRVPPAINGE